MRRDPLTDVSFAIGSLGLIGLVILALVWLRCPNGTCLTTTVAQPSSSSNFSACAQAGDPSLESYPRQCPTSDGRSFTEAIENTPGVAARIYVDYPQPNAVVTSPLRVLGAARGPWYFEASFPVKLLDASDEALVIQPAQAHGEWLTTDFVPFSVTLTFTLPTTTTGTLVLEKDNPSGLPEHAAELRFPVRFR